MHKQITISNKNVFKNAMFHGMEIVEYFLVTQVVRYQVYIVLQKDSVGRQIFMRHMHRQITILDQNVHKDAIFLMMENAENQMETQAVQNLINTVLNSDSAIH